MNTQFVSELEANGYFRGLPPDRAQSLKSDLLQRGWPAIFGNSHRMFMSDAEELAEGGISNLVVRVSPFLAAERVEIPLVEDVFSEAGYSLRIGNRTKLIHGAADLRREQSNEPGLIWGLSMVRAFSFIDDLLESAGSPERVYAVNGANDLSAYFLTPTLHRVICAHPDSTTADAPYRPKAEYPAFGQPGT